MWVNNRTRLFWNTLLAYHKVHPDIMQQPALSAVVQKLRKSPNVTDKLHADRLDVERFVNGFRFYEAYRTLKSGMTAQRAKGVVGVHHNWALSNDMKWSRARAYNTITEPKESYEDFAKRVQMGMRFSPGQVTVSRLGAKTMKRDYSHCKPWGNYVPGYEYKGQPKDKGAA